MPRRVRCSVDCVAWCCHQRIRKPVRIMFHGQAPLVEAPINIIKHDDLARQYWRIWKEWLKKIPGFKSGLGDHCVQIQSRSDGHFMALCIILPWWPQKKADVCSSRTDIGLIFFLRPLKNTRGPVPTLRLCHYLSSPGWIVRHTLFRQNSFHQFSAILVFVCPQASAPPGWVRSWAEPAPCYQWCMTLFPEGPRPMNSFSNFMTASLISASIWPLVFSVISSPEIICPSYRYSRPVII